MAKRMKLDKRKLGLITGLVADCVFIVGVPLRQMHTPLKFLSGIHGNTAAAVGINWQGTIIGILLAFTVYFFVGWIVGYIYERV